MPNDDKKILRDFYLFWRWEYVKRCDIKELQGIGVQAHKLPRTTNAKDLYFGLKELVGQGNSLSDLLTKGINHRVYDLDIFKFSVQESQVDYYFGNSSTDIINSIIKKQMLYHYPNADMGYSAAMPLHELIEDIQIFQNTPDWETHMVTQEDVTKEVSDLGYLVLINPKAEIDVLIDEIRKIHLGSDKHQLDSHINSILKSICLENANEPRAVGLWMWDFITERYGPGKPPHGKIAEARRELEKNFDLSQLGYAESRPETIEGHYRKTRECIKVREVLPF